MIKIAFFDIDGTLLKLGNKQPTENTITALKRLQENGILICMATGRSYPAIPHFDGVNFDILLTFNGSYVANNSDVIFNSPFDEHDKNIVINNLKNMNRAIAISNIQTIVTNGTDEDLEKYFEFGGEKLIISEGFNELCKGDIYQIMCSCKEEEYEQILKETNNTKIAAWWDRAADIIPADCGKGRAIKTVLNFYGFNKDEAIAFGDGQNDIEMLEAVGTAVVMANAKDEVKQHADFICRSVDEDGVYHYCLEHRLI